MRMTKSRQNQIRRKIQESRSRLMEKQPFFGILLMYLGFVAVDNIRNMSTNGKCIFLNADFIAKLYPAELDFLLCHQLMHIINGDLCRGQAFAGDDFHRACDIYNNDQLIRIGWDVNGFSHLGKLQYVIPGSHVQIDTLTTYEIFDMLPYKLKNLDERTRRRYMTDSDFYWDIKYSEYVDGIVIIDVPQITKYVDGLEKDQDMEAFWTSQVERAEVTVRKLGKHAGKLPAGVRREITKGKKSIIDWRKVLDEFLQEETTDYSFTPTDRRYMDWEFFLPDFNEKEYMPKDILFMADTSVSVSRDDLSKVYAEICGAIEQFGGKLRGKLGFFDRAVTKAVPFEDIEDIKGIIPYGGGGTDFDIIFEYVREQEREYLPAMIVIFTDGYARFPEKEAAMNIPVLWLVSNEDVDPPWGRVGRVVREFDEKN